MQFFHRLHDSRCAHKWISPGELGAKDDAVYTGCLCSLQATRRVFNRDTGFSVHLKPIQCNEVWLRGRLFLRVISGGDDKGDVLKERSPLMDPFEVVSARAGHDCHPRMSANPLEEPLHSRYREIRRCPKQLAIHRVPYLPALGNLFLRPSTRPEKVPCPGATAEKPIQVLPGVKFDPVKVEIAAIRFEEERFCIDKDAVVVPENGGLHRGFCTV